MLLCISNTRDLVIAEVHGYSTDSGAADRSPYLDHLEVCSKSIIQTDAVSRENEYKLFLWDFL